MQVRTSRAEVPPWASVFPDREWQQSTDLQKQLRLREQLGWAQVHGGLRRVRDFLAGLRESDWQHSQPMDWPKI